MTRIVPLAALVRVSPLGSVMVTELVMAGVAVGVPVTLGKQAWLAEVGTPLCQLLGSVQVVPSPAPVQVPGETLPEVLGHDGTGVGVRPAASRDDPICIGTRRGDAGCTGTSCTGTSCLAAEPAAGARRPPAVRADRRRGRGRRTRRRAAGTAAVGRGATTGVAAWSVSDRAVATTRRPAAGRPRTTARPRARLLAAGAKPDRPALRGEGSTVDDLPRILATPPAGERVDRKDGASHERLTARETCLRRPCRMR